MSSAVITGVTGQFGSYLAENLLAKGYEVIGVRRRNSNPNLDRLESCLADDKFKLIEGDLIDPSSINSIVTKYQPNEFYNCAAQSHVGTSFEQPAATLQINTVGVLNCLESIRHYSPQTKFLQMSTSEMFGSNYTIGGFKNEDTYQDENTPFVPRSPYGVSKVAAHHLVRNYREAYNLQGSCMIMFNCESPRRGENFLTRKVSLHVANLNRACEDALERQNDEIWWEYPKLKLGNLDARRDWGYAPEYAEVCTKIIQTNDDFVICTEETHTIAEFVEEAFKVIGMTYPWRGLVEIDDQFKRPSDVEFLHGRCTKAREKLGWEPEVKFKELVKIMVEADVAKKKLC